MANDKDFLIPAFAVQNSDHPGFILPYKIHTHLASPGFGEIIPSCVITYRRQHTDTDRGKGISI